MAPNILLAPNMTQNAERKHRTQNTNTAHNRPPISSFFCRMLLRFSIVCLSLKLQCPSNLTNWSCIVKIRKVRQFKPMWKLSNRNHVPDVSVSALKGCIFIHTICFIRCIGFSVNGIVIVTGEFLLETNGACWKISTIWSLIWTAFKIYNCTKIWKRFY